MESSSLGHLGSFHHQPQFQQQHLGLKKPIIKHPGIHHGVGHGVGHHGHGFRSQEEEEQSSAVETEVTELKNADAFKENLETGLESNIKMAKVAVDNMKRDLAEMESTANARKQWKHSDSKSDTILHDNIEAAKEALENVQTSFDNLQAINTKKIGAKNAEAIQDEQLEKLTEEERMAKWKSAIETIQKNVEIANNIKQSLTSGKAEEHEMVPSQEARPLMTKPVIVDALKKPSKENSDTEMEVSASTKVEMRHNDDKQEGKMMNEKSSWHQKNEMKAVASPMEKNAESSPKERKESHLNHETSKTSMKATENEGLSEHEEKKINDDITSFKAAESGTVIEKDEIKMHHESHNEPSKMHEIKKEREGEASSMEKSAHHEAAIKAADEPAILNTKATRKFGSEEVIHHDSEKSSEQNFGQHGHMKPQNIGKGAAVDTTTLMKERDAHSSMKETEMEHQASEMKSSEVPFKNENMEEKLVHDNVKSAKAIDTAMHSGMQSAMRADENVQMINNPKHHEDARSLGSASYGPSVAISAPSYGPSNIVSGGYGAAAPNYGPSVAASSHVPVSYGVNLAAPSASYAPSHSYGAASSYGSGLGGPSGSGISVNLGGSGPSGAVGVFPNARLGGCAVPLLLSCSPSVVSGNLANVHPSYGSQAASYGAAVGPGSYKANEQLSSHNKRDVKINKFPAKKARRSFSPILEKKF